MLHAMTREQTLVMEEGVMESLGIGLPELMERVGRDVAAAAARFAPRGRIVVVTGKGNNAGDGWVAARLLFQEGREVEVAAVAGPDQLSGVALDAATTAIEAGIAWIECSGSVLPGLAGAALVVDAMFGFGLRGPAKEPFAGVIEAVNAAGRPVLAVDLPSGVEADTGRAHGNAIRADATLAVITPKLAHFLEPGARLSGRIEVARVGLPEDATAECERVELWEAPDVHRVLPVAGVEDHKGSRGRVLLVGGSAGMAGSIGLAAEGALRMGAGYAVAAVPASVVDVVNRTSRPAVAVGLAETGERSLSLAAFESIRDMAGESDAIVIGPGLSSNAESRELARRIVASVDRPLVVDADALNALAEDHSPLAGRRAPTVITPHPGEAARLLGTDSKAVQEDRIGAVRRLADWSVVAVLKGAGTLVLEGGRIAANTTGNPGMATMGSGDVMAGMIGALLAQGMVAYESAVVGVYLHGLAGDIAERELTAQGMTAEDVASRIPAALVSVSESVLPPIGDNL